MSKNYATVDEIFEELSQMGVALFYIDEYEKVWNSIQKRPWFKFTAFYSEDMIDILNCPIFGVNFNTRGFEIRLDDVNYVHHDYMMNTNTNNPYVFDDLVKNVDILTDVMKFIEKELMSGRYQVSYFEEQNNNIKLNEMSVPILK